MICTDASVFELDWLLLNAHRRSVMKKHVTFAEPHVHRLHPDETLQRRAGVKVALKDAGGLNIDRPAAARPQPQTQQEMSGTQIPNARTAAPFLKHSALTPAQREYLHSVSASSSSAHVRGLITRHYMNVLHTCVRAGVDPGDLVVASVTSAESESEKSKTQSDSSSRAKHKGKIRAGARHPGKSFLPKIPQNRRVRPPNTSASKHKMKKSSASQTPRGQSPTRAGIRLMEEDEDEEDDDALSECLSSLSVGEWDDNTFSD